MGSRAVRQAVAMAVVVALALPARASDGSDSGASSGDSFGGSGDSSAGSGDSSAGSGDSSAGSGASSEGSSGQTDASAASTGESGAATGASSDQSIGGTTGGTVQGTAQSAAGTAGVTAVTLITGTSVGGVFLTVWLVRVATEKPDPPTIEAALMRAYVVSERRDLNVLMALAASSPSWLDQLALEAAAGDGPELDALARALRVSREEAVAADRAATARQARVATDAEAVRFLVFLLEAAAPAVRVDATATADVLWQLAKERRSGAPGRAHARLAAWMGVPAEDAWAATEALPTERALLHREAVPLADGVALAIGARRPEAVRARVAALTAPVRAVVEADTGEPSGEPSGEPAPASAVGVAAAPG